MVQLHHSKKANIEPLYSLYKYLKVTMYKLSITKSVVVFNFHFFYYTFSSIITTRCKIEC